MSLAGKSAIDQYIEGEYYSKHPDWHLSESDNKAADLQPALSAMLRDSRQKKWSIADIGAGAGGALNGTIQLISKIDPTVEVEACGFEISPQAVAKAAQKFPKLSMRSKLFEASDGPFDAVMFIDVLEHVENP